jgi:hypothetical protein
LSRETWKKVFSTIKDEDLAELAGGWAIQIKGFRQVNQENIKMARAMVIAEALKPRNLKMIKAFYSITDDQNDEVPEKRKDESVEDLINKYEQGTSLHFIIGSLYAGKDQKQHHLAGELEAALLEKYEVDDLAGLPDNGAAGDEEQETAEVTGVSARTSELEKKLSKSVEKNKDLRALVADWQKKYSELKKQLKDEKQGWISEKLKLHQELGTEKAQHKETVGKNQATHDENDRLKEEVAKLKAENSHLNAMLLNNNKEVSVTESAEVAKTDKRETEGLQVLLIGDPKNKLTENSAKHIFHVLELKSIPGALETGELDDYDEVWVMTYLVPPQMRRKIKRNVKNNLVEFSDFPSMKCYIEKG